MPSFFSPEQLLQVIAYQTEIASTRMDLGEVLDRTVERAQALLGAEGAVVELAEGTDMVYRAASGIASSQLGLRVPREGSLSGKCVEQGIPLISIDSLEDPRVHQAAVRAVGLRSMVLVPLRHAGQAVGVLKLISREPGRFGQDSADLLGLLTGVIAAAVSHAAEYDQSQAQAETFYRMATRDALTGLANRALFFDQCRQSMALARRQDRPVAIALLDMDGLKAINDAHGHGAGDAAIRTLGERLQAHTRASDLAARLGGDEFALLLNGLSGPESAGVVMDSIPASVNGPMAFEGKTLELRVSAGLAIHPEDGGTVEALLEQADQRMYAQKRAKGAGRGRP